MLQSEPVPRRSHGPPEPNSGLGSLPNGGSAPPVLTTTGIETVERISVAKPRRGFWPAGVRAAELPLVLCALLFAGAGCRKEMWVQPKYKPLDMTEFFDDTMSSRPLIEGTVAQGQFHTNTSFYAGLAGRDLVEDFPLALTEEGLRRGQERYNIFCAVCHGPGGDGDGMVVKRGFPSPPSYHLDRLRQAPIGHFFQVISRGYGAMYPYSTRVPPEDRWLIAAYIRALQLSRAAPLELASPAAQENLLKAQP